MLRDANKSCRHFLHYHGRKMPKKSVIVGKMGEGRNYFVKKVKKKSRKYLVVQNKFLFLQPQK